MFNSKKVGSTVAVATFISLLGGCGSIGSDDDTWLTGNFIDSAVEGVEYRASGETGITDAEGTFRYKKGDSVSFSIGGIQLGTVAGDTLITPYSFSVSGGNEATDIVINIARLLQTLDEDGDPENGILITEAIRLEAENLTMMLDQSAETFAEDSAVAAAFTQLGAHLSYNFERVKSINDAMAHLDATLSGDSGSDGGDNGGSDGGSDGGDNGGSDGGSDGGDNGGSDGGSDGGDNGGSDGGSDGGDNGGSDGGSDGGDNGGSVSYILQVSGNDGALSKIESELEVRDIAIGYTAFTGVEESVLLVGGSDLDSVETLSSLDEEPQNAFALVAAFADGTQFTGASLLATVDGEEFTFECTINCEVNVDIDNKEISFIGAEFIWDDGNDSIEINGTVPWIASDEYVDTSDWVGSELPSDSTFCDTNLSTSVVAMANGGLAYTTNAGNCIGLASVEHNTFTKPLTAVIVNEGDSASTGSLAIDSAVKIYTRLIDRGVDYTDDGGQPVFEAIVEGAFDITNTSSHELCLSDYDDWQLLQADGTALTKSLNVSYQFNDTPYTMEFSALHDFDVPGVKCLPPSASATVHLSLDQFMVRAEEEILFSTVTEIAVFIEAEYNAVANNVTYTTLTPDFMEWLYVDGSPGIRLAFTNTSGAQLVLDDSAQEVWFYNDQGYPIVKSYVYLHKQLGVEEYDLVNSDYVINDGTQIQLLDDSAEIAILALGGGTAVKAVLYPAF